VWLVRETTTVYGKGGKVTKVVGEGGKGRESGGVVYLCYANPSTGKKDRLLEANVEFLKQEFITRRVLMCFHTSILA
jgi:hypothetical protein